MAKRKQKTGAQEDPSAQTQAVALSDLPKVEAGIPIPPRTGNRRPGKWMSLWKTLQIGESVPDLTSVQVASLYNAAQKLSGAGTLTRRAEGNGTFRVWRVEKRAPMQKSPTESTPEPVQAEATSAN